MVVLGLSEAGEGLRDFFGPRLEASRADGPDVMVDALVEKFKIDKGGAKKLVDDLIKAGSVHFVPGRDRTGLAAELTGESGQLSVDPLNQRLAGTEGPVGGYWQL